MTELEALVKEAQESFHACDTPVALENAKAQYLGKTGRVTALTKSLASLDIEIGRAHV